MRNGHIDLDGYQAALSAFNAGRHATAEEMFAGLDVDLTGQLDTGGDFRKLNEAESRRIAADPEWGVFRALVCHGRSCALFELGRTVDALFEAERACRYFERTAPSDVRYAHALSNVATFNATHGTEEAAMEALDKAMTIMKKKRGKRDRAAFLAAVGYLCLGRGMPAEAAKMYEKALKALPDSRRLKDNLAFARRKSDPGKGVE
jgi:tetratricopeptide (TPR) repeat protein